MENLIAHPAGFPRIGGEGEAMPGPTWALWTGGICSVPLGVEGSGFYPCAIASQHIRVQTCPCASIGEICVNGCAGTRVHLHHCMHPCSHPSLCALSLCAGICVCLCGASLDIRVPAPGWVECVHACSHACIPLLLFMHLCVSEPAQASMCSSMCIHVCISLWICPCIHV